MTSLFDLFNATSKENAGSVLVVVAVWWSLTGEQCWRLADIFGNRYLACQKWDVHSHYELGRTHRTRTRLN